MRYEITLKVVVEADDQDDAVGYADEFVTEAMAMDEVQDASWEIVSLPMKGDTK